MSSCCRRCTILPTFRFRSACLSLRSQTPCSATLPEIGVCDSEFKGTTLQRWDVKTLCNTDSCLRHVAAARLSPSPLFIYFRHSLGSTLPSQTRSSIIGMQEDGFHSAAIKPLRMGGEWKAFCFVFVLRCFSVI